MHHKWEVYCYQKLLKGKDTFQNTDYKPVSKDTRYACHAWRGRCPQNVLPTHLEIFTRKSFNPTALFVEQDYMNYFYKEAIFF